MRVLYAFLCDDAQEGTDERLDAHGIFRRLYTRGFPAEHRGTLVVAVEWDEGETGEHSFRIDLLDPSRSPVMTASGHTTVPAERDPNAPPPMTRFLLPIERMVFPVAGRYEFQLHLDDQELPVAPLQLIEQPDLEI